MAVEVLGMAAAGKERSEASDRTDTRVEMSLIGIGHDKPAISGEEAESDWVAEGRDGYFRKLDGVGELSKVITRALVEREDSVSKVGRCSVSHPCARIKEASVLFYTSTVSYFHSSEMMMVVITLMLEGGEAQVNHCWIPKCIAGRGEGSKASVP